MTAAAIVARPNWKCQRFRSPFHGIYGSVVEADADVLGVAWDLDPERADVRALGEAVERAALQEAPGPTISGTASKLGERAISLEKRVSFDEVQCDVYPELKAFDWNPDVLNDWVSMNSPRGEIFVPADLERMRLSDADNRRPAPMTSVGTACGDDLNEALDRAMAEVVERHAVARMVYSGQRAQIISSKDAIYSVADIGAKFADAATLTVGILPYRVFGMTIAVAALAGTSPELPQLAFGSAAARDEASAIRSAALEATHIFHLGWRLIRRGDVATQVTTINSRALAWSKAPVALLDNYFDSSDRNREGIPASHTRSSSSEWREIGDAMTSEGIDWAYSDITPSWSGSFNVARVVAPALLRLHANEFALLHAPAFEQDVSRFKARTDAAKLNVHPFL